MQRIRASARILAYETSLAGPPSIIYIVGNEAIMKASETTVVIFPGGSGNANTPKLSLLSEIARRKGFKTEAIDSSQIPNPEDRIQLFLGSSLSKSRQLVLAGSSMGGYVATVVADALDVDGLFLLAPVLYLEPYENLDPRPKSRRISVIHGTKDEVVPLEHSERFTERFGADLHTVEDTHSLGEQADVISAIFSEFLNELIKPNQPLQRTATSRRL